MPTYSNSNTTPVAVGSNLRLEPGQSGTSLECVFPLPDGVTMTSAQPGWNPFIYSTVTTSSGNYNLPTTLQGNYKITFTLSAGSTGSVAIQPNGFGNSRNIVAGETVTITHMSRLLNSIYWTVTGTVSLSVTVEQI